MKVEDISDINSIGTTVRKIQLIALDILIEVERIFKKHDIDFWLINGTLLGAIRHKGFIPWDDDLDISIKQYDLKKAKKALINELPENFALQSPETDENYFIQSLIKIRHKKSLFYMEDHKTFKEQGIFIDIIPLEKIPSKRFKKFVFDFNKHPYLYKKEKAIKGKSSNIKGRLMWPFSQFLINVAHIYSRVSSTNQYGFNYLYWIRGGRFYKTFDKEILFPLRETEFEGKKFKIPNDSDSFLTEMYGDYMIIPPIEKREIHASKIEFYD